LFFSPPQEAITTNETIFVDQNFLSREREKDVCQTNSGKIFWKFLKTKIYFFAMYRTG
jgi:hypothetical protein